MMFRDKSISKFYAFSLAAVFALTLAAAAATAVPLRWTTIWIW